MLLPAVQPSLEAREDYRLCKLLPQWNLTKKAEPRVVIDHLWLV